MNRDDPRYPRRIQRPPPHVLAEVADPQVRAVFAREYRGLRRVLHVLRHVRREDLIDGPAVLACAPGESRLKGCTSALTLAARTTTFLVIRRVKADFHTGSWSRIVSRHDHHSRGCVADLMEAFEAFVALALEEEGFVVSPAVKFPVRRRTGKTRYEEWQEHGYEVDLVGARSDLLVLATVKSFFGSRGVTADAVTGRHQQARGMYRVLNDPDIRNGVVEVASERYGYPQAQVELRLYVGRFAGRARGKHEQQIREWAASQQIGRGPIKVVGLTEVVRAVRQAADRTQYRDNPALVAVKVLGEAGHLVSLEETE